MRFMKLVTILIVAIGVFAAFLYNNRYTIYKKMIEAQFTRMKSHPNDIGAFCLQYENGEIKKFGLSSAHLNCSATMVINNDNEFFSKLFLYKNVGLGETFVDGVWNAAPNDDISDMLVKFAFKLHIRDYTYLESIVTFLNPGLWSNWLERNSVAKSVSEDKYTISYHYDVGNDFYFNFLGPTMMYTCSFFKDYFNDLQTAQHNKIDTIIKKLNIVADDNILDVGSGWGYMASYIVNKTGARIDGIALAKEQIRRSQNYFNPSNKNTAGPNYYYADYREYCKDMAHQKQYNKIYSIGMLEHVHSKRIDEFMACMYDLFMDESPDNKSMLLGLHYISLNNVFPNVDPWDANHKCTRVTWVGKYMLPGGCLLHTDWVQEAGRKAGFVLLHKETYGLHYARTVRIWRENIENNWNEMIKNHPDYDDRLKRSYIFLFATAEVGFRMGFMDLTQHIFIKPSKQISGYRDGKLNDIINHITTRHSD